MILQIVLTAHHAQITLEDQERVVDSAEFSVNNNLSNHLLLEIDALLKRNNADPMSIEHVEFHSSDAGFTSERIGQAVINAYNFALPKKTERK